MFYELRYTKAIQAILGTEGGKAVLDMLGMSIPAVGWRVEECAQRNGPRHLKNLSPQAAAVGAVALFGMWLAEFGQTEAECLAGTALQMAIMDYTKQNPLVEPTTKLFLGHWLADRPHTRRQCKG
jgi:hypothetical protein